MNTALNYTLTLAFAVFAFTLSGCDNDPLNTGGPDDINPIVDPEIGDPEKDPTPAEGEGEGEGEPEPEPGDGFAESTGAKVVWKRAAVLNRDLSRALEIPRDELCIELDGRDCFADVHLAPLGGHDPIDLAQYEGLGQPSRLTPIALERVALAACQKRFDLDVNLSGAGQPPVVFTFPLTFEAVTLEDTASLADTLYPRLFARRATDDERATLDSLVDDGISKRDAALMSCFALVSSSETLFF
jgi:hypothetical protein